LRDEEALTSYFRGNTDASADEVSRIVNAFLAVKELSSFSEAEDSDDVSAEPDEDDDVTESSPRIPKEQPNIPPVGGNSPNVTVNIQLQLPADATGEIYDKFFAAMKKHGLIN
jgi:hypothetical protein